MQRPLYVLFVALLTACGGNGVSPVAPPAAMLMSLSTALGPTGTPYEIHGAEIPGFAGATFSVRFRAEDAPLTDSCASDEVVGVVTWTSASVLSGRAPAASVLRDTLAYVTVDLPGGPLRSTSPIATFLGTPDPTADQDGNGVRDGCDPNTYTFEDDRLGAPPSDVTHLGLPSGLTVADINGERVARYAGGNTGSHDRLDRVRADMPQQDTDVYVDWDDTASVGSIELWSEGSFSGFSGAGLIVQIRSGLIYCFRRLWRTVPSTIGPALPANGRMRIRVRKGAGFTSVVHVDSWNGSAWDADLVTFPIADDRNFQGRDTVFAEYSGGIRGIKRITVVPAPSPAALVASQSSDGLVPWRLFQRDSNDTATIPVDVRYRLDGPGQLQARVVHSDNGLALPGHDFENHAQSLPAGQSASTRLNLVGVPAGGNYDVQVRLLNAVGDLVSQIGINNVSVGDVYICAGQSNMSGYSGSVAGATVPLAQVHRLHNDGRWDQAVEPIDDGTGQLDAISREFPAHSLMLPFARHLYETTGVPVALVPTSLGGTNLHTQWQRDVSLPAWRATLYGSMLHRARVATGGVAPAGLLWFQGESDAINARTTAQYVADLEQLIAHVRTDLGAPDMIAVVAQLGTFSAANPALWLPIQEAQREVARNDARVALVTTVDAPRADAIHFNVAGYQTIGQRFADHVRALRFAPALDPLTELVSAAVGSSSDEIDLTYDAPITGGAASLYSVQDDSGAATVTALQSSGAVITLTLDRALGTNATIRYGLAVAPSAAWVVDTNSVPVPCFDAVSIN